MDYQESFVRSLELKLLYLISFLVGGYNFITDSGNIGKRKRNKGKGGNQN